MSRTIFITGTGTGVGKTVLATLLLSYLRNSGVNTLAMKPFCSGGTEDLEAFRRIQGDELLPEVLNPYYFPEPLAPLVASRVVHRTIRHEEVLGAIRTARSKCACLIVEGAGGVLVPITEGVSMADLAAALNCEVLVVAQNIIGTLNHTFLSIEALRQRGVSRIKVILMEQAEPDLSAATNLRFITTTIENIGVYSIPRIQKCGKMCDTKLKGTKKLKKTLAQITSPDSFTSVVRNAAKAAKRKIEKQK